MTLPCSNTPSLATLASAPARVTGSYLQPLLDTAAERGVPASVLCAAAGLPPATLASIPEELPVSSYIALLEAGARQANDPHFGLHVGEKVSPAAYSAYGMVLLASSNFGHAMQLTQRFESLAHDLGRSVLAVEGAVAHYEWLSHYPQANRHLVESVYAGIRVFGSWLAGRQLMPLAIRFMHADPGHGNAEYLRVLGIAPQFGAPRHSATFDSQLLAMPIPNADTSLYPVLLQHAERLLEQRSVQAEPLVAKVRAALLPRLRSGEAKLAPVAAELGLSARTLQRKLAEAGSSFQGELDALRFSLAQDYLRQRDLGLVDIAFLLGFQEQSAFTHAFREWSGINPGAWRERVA